LLFKKEKKVILEEPSATFKLVFDPDKTCIKEYETLLNGLYGLQYTHEANNNPWFTFGIISQGSKTEFYVNLPTEFENIFKKKYAAINPHTQFEIIEDPIINFKENIVEDEVFIIDGYKLKLAHDDSNKMLKTSESDKRFLSNLINAMNGSDTKDVSILEITLRYINQINTSDNEKFKKRLSTVNTFVGKCTSNLIDEIIGTNLSAFYGTDKKNKSKRTIIINDDEDIDIDVLPKMKVSIKIMSKSIDKIQTMDNIKGMASVFTDLNSSNSLIPLKMNYKEVASRNINVTDYNILSTLEISQFLHLPDKSISADNLKSSNIRKAYDKNVPTEGIIFGDSNNIPVAFPITNMNALEYSKRYPEIERIVDNIVKPKLVLGQQGTGKSEWVINLIISYAKAGLGVIAMDPKNDTQQRLLESMPPELLSKVDYINFGDTEYPPAMNLFKKRKKDDPTENSLIVNSFISLMKKEFDRSWGIKIQKWLQMTAEAILLNEISTLNEFELMITDRTFREYMIQVMKIKMEEIDKGKSHIKKLIKYWEKVNSLKDEIIAKETEPVMNQIGVFLSNRVIKTIVSQQDSYDFRKAADEGRIVIINLPEGVLGDNTKLLGSMINKSIWLDLQSRANVDISKRFPVMWIIDEAHEVVDDEFIGILTKGRAYRLGLTLVTQGLSNFKMRGMENIRELILTNCKNKIAFRLGFFDSKDLAEEFTPIGGNDMANCPDYHFYSKILLENGSVSDPFFVHAPLMAKKLRNYDQFLANHRSGKFTIDEIEDELDNRLDAIIVLNKLAQGY
jgi:hypothetical protein